MPHTFPTSASPSASRSRWRGRGPHGLLGRDLAVDLGTARTTVYLRRRGVLLDEPTVVAVDGTTGEPDGLGHEAVAAAARAPELVAAVRPIRGGVVADFDLAVHLLREALAGVVGRALARPRLVLAVPAAATDVERQVLEETARRAGARASVLLDAPVAAAIGVGLPVHEPRGNFVVTLGAGVTEAAVVAAGRVVASTSLPVGGDLLDATLAAWLRREHSLAVHPAVAERLKTTAGSAYPLAREGRAEVAGRDLVTGRPRRVRVTTAEVRQALEEPLRDIVEAVTDTLDRAPQRLIDHVRARGIVLAGGGAGLRGLDERVGFETGLPVHVADQPGLAVVLGAGRCAESFDTLRRVVAGERRSA